jgi:hypothetical protein
LPQPLRIPCHRGVAPRIAVAPDRPKAVESIPAPGIPPLEDVRLLGSQEALAFITSPFALGEGRRLEIPHHRPAPHARLLGNGARGPTLAVQCPDLLIDGEPSRPALRRLRPGLQRRYTRWHGDGVPAIGLRDGCAAERCAHGFQRVPVGPEGLIQRFDQDLQVRCWRVDPTPVAQRHGRLPGSRRCGSRPEHV